LIAIIVSTTCYLHFVSYMLMLASFSVVGLYWWGLSSRVLSWVGSGVWLSTGSISCIIGDVTCDISGGISWRIGRSVGRGAGSEIDRLHYFVFASSLFSYRLKGTIAMTSLARVFRSALGVRACSRSTISSTSFFDLSGGDANMSLEAPYCRSVFELT
jgi:hypothetical protein